VAPGALRALTHCSWSVCIPVTLLNSQMLGANTAPYSRSHTHACAWRKLRVDATPRIIGGTGEPLFEAAAEVRMEGTVMHIKNTARAVQGVAARRGTLEKEGVRRADQWATAARTVGVACARAPSGTLRSTVACAQSAPSARLGSAYSMPSAPHPFQDTRIHARRQHMHDRLNNQPNGAANQTAATTT
jgi:hypothetical protein